MFAVRQQTIGTELVHASFLGKTGQMLQGQEETVRLSSLLTNTTKMDIDDSRNRDGNGGVYALLNLR